MCRPDLVRLDTRAIEDGLERLFHARARRHGDLKDELSGFADLELESCGYGTSHGS
jgi:hypothetical protein